jgi:ketosteroid isomerase-like protein
MNGSKDRMAIHALAVLNETLTGWSKAAADWDARKLGTLYCEDACLFGGRPGHSNGRAEIIRYFAGYENIILSASIKPLDQEVFPLDQRLVIAQGYVEFEFVLGNGNTTKSLLRSTLILKKEKDQWKISHHHFSSIPTTPPLGEQ